MPRYRKTNLWRLRTRRAVPQVLLIGLVLYSVATLSSTVVGEDNPWRMYGFDAENTFCNTQEDRLRPPLKPAWRITSNTSLDAITVANGKVLASGMGKPSSNVVTCFDSRDGAVLWSFELTQGGRGAMGVSPAIVNGKVIFGGQFDDGLYALEIESGQLVWQLGGMKYGLFSNSPKVRGDCLIINANGGPVASIDVTSGDMRWKSNVVGRQGMIALSDDLVFVTRIVPNAQPMIALDSGSGELRWTAPLHCASCVTVGNDLVFAPCWDDEGGHVDRLVAFQAKTGNIAWETQFEDDLRYARMTLLDGVLFLASGSREETSSLYAMDPETGAIRDYREGLPRVGRLLSSNGVVYVGMYRAGLHAIDPKTLETIWQAPVAGCRDCIIANGKLFLASGRTLICLTNEDESKQSETREETANRQDSHTAK